MVEHYSDQIDFHGLNLEEELTRLFEKTPQYQVYIYNQYKLLIAKS